MIECFDHTVNITDLTAHCSRFLFLSMYGPKISTVLERIAHIYLQYLPFFPSLGTSFQKPSIFQKWRKRCRYRWLLPIMERHGIEPSNKNNSEFCDKLWPMLETRDQIFQQIVTNVLFRILFSPLERWSLWHYFQCYNQSFQDNTLLKHHLQFKIHQQSQSSTFYKVGRKMKDRGTLQ